MLFTASTTRNFATTVRLRWWSSTLRPRKTSRYSLGAFLTWTIRLGSSMHGTPTPTSFIVLPHWRSNFRGLQQFRISKSASWSRTFPGCFPEVDTEMSITHTRYPENHMQMKLGQRQNHGIRQGRSYGASTSIIHTYTSSFCSTSLYFVFSLRFPGVLS